MVETLPKEICGYGNPKPVQEVKDIDKKVTEKATDNWKNPVYRKFKINT